STTTTKSRELVVVERVQIFHSCAWKLFGSYVQYRICAVSGVSGSAESEDDGSHRKLPSIYTERCWICWKFADCVHDGKFKVTDLFCYLCREFENLLHSDKVISVQLTARSHCLSASVPISALIS
ncbi:unnamed protein product, partial [Sphacelaria rigidula]